MLPLVARVAVENTAYHFDKLYDYLVPPGLDLAPGQRVVIPFGRGKAPQRMGLVLEVASIPPEELPRYCDTDIYAVWQYDAAHNTEYLETLFSYLRQNRSVKTAARELHLHRNTVNYRVGRLQELFGINLEDAHATCRMLVSCEILRMLPRAKRG